MPRNVCCVPGCPVVAEDGVPLHYFPSPEKDAEKFQSWVKIIGGDTASLDSTTFQKTQRICRRHFQKEFLYPKNRLCKLAVPSLLLSFADVSAPSQMDPDSQPSTSQEAVSLNPKIIQDSTRNVEYIPCSSVAKKMSDSNSQSRLVSYEQMKTVIDFMAEHVEFASGNLRSLEARHMSKRLWEELTKMLNSCRGGTKKTPDGWSKYWSDFKNKLKNKVSLLKKKKSGAPLKGIRPLTKMEKRTIAILGPYYDKRKTRRGYGESNSNNLHPVVKVETCQETIHVDSFSKSNSGSSDRLSGGDDQSNDSAESSGGEYANGTHSDEPAIRKLYPQWLIEVEKKRADAELIRAKAEEQRVTVATKNAEAALLQAEALKRLADAASTQAEAIMRIAAVLEMRGQRDMLAL